MIVHERSIRILVVILFFLNLMFTRSRSLLISIGHMRRAMRATMSTNYDTIGYRNTQKKVIIDKVEVLRCTNMIKDILNVSEFHVDLWFCTETKIRELNKEHRGVRKSTDVLSFPANNFVAPEIFEDDPTLEFDKHLGDLVIAPSYVLRRCEEDNIAKTNDELDLDDDRGVSREMANIFEVQGRIPLLIIHGMLHLLGHDHETDNDWKIMTNREENVLQKLRQAIQLQKMMTYPGTDSNPSLPF